MTSQPGSCQIAPPNTTVTQQSDATRRKAAAKPPIATPEPAEIAPAMAEEPLPGPSNSATRKRKLKFSESELESLIEGVVAHHAQLFGANSRRVPEQEKRRIWVGIASSVNAVGVAARSVEDIKKRWYDLRGRAKERVAARLGESSGTGGGGPTVPPNTPLEDQVEDTLEREACVGVTTLDSSRPTHNTQGADDSSDSERLVIVEEAQEEVSLPATLPPSPAAAATPAARPTTLPAAKSAGPPPAKVRPPTNVPPVPAAPATPAATTPAARPPRSGPATSVAQRQKSRRGKGHLHACMSVERRMLRLHQRQSQQQGAIQLQLQKIGRNVAGVGQRVDRMTAAIERMAVAMEANTAALGKQRSAARRRHHHLVSQMATYSRSNYAAANATSQLSRRSMTQQHQLVQCCEEITRVLEHLSTAVVPLLQPVVPAVVGGDDGSEAASSLSSNSATQAPPPRRSTRATPGPSGQDEDEEPQRRLGNVRRKQH